MFARDPLLSFVLIGTLGFAAHAHLRGAADASDDALLYAEAKRLGLDEDDPIVRRRLVQKMEMLLDRRVELERPSEAVLAAHRAAHADALAPPPTFSLEQRFFSKAPANVEEAFAREPEPFLHGREFQRLTEARASALFGPAFARALPSLDPARWIGPITSPYGVHFLRGGPDPRAPAPEAAVLEHYRRERRREARDTLIAELRARGPR